MRELAEKTELGRGRILGWLGVWRGKFSSWTNRYGKVNEHKAQVPRDHWLEPEERAQILEFHRRHPLEGYRRLTYMMLDEDVVAVSPATTYRVLAAAGVIDRWKRRPSLKGTGFVCHASAGTRQPSWTVLESGCSPGMADGPATCAAARFWARRSRAASSLRSRSAQICSARPASQSLGVM